MREHRREGDRRVVVTGLGMITPLGHNVADTWASILAGRSGLGEFTLMDRGDHLAGGVCEIKDFDPVLYLGRKKARRRDRFQQLATVAANEAMKQAGLGIIRENGVRAGIYLGTGVGGIQTLVNQEHVLLEKGLRRLSPFGITMIMPNGAAGMLSIDFGVLGPSTTIATACAAGNDAIGHAYKRIRYGELDVVLTGGAESILTSVAIEHAATRGATILAEITGYGQTTDAFHITAPAKGGAGAVRAIEIALIDADIMPNDVDYVNAHGTGTLLNDLNETIALKKVFGDHAYNMSISSTKSMTGHIMGATGAIESIFCILAIRDQILPPTINYKTPDPECDLDYVPNEARPAKVSVTANNAFGFGGHNSVLIIKEFVE